MNEILESGKSFFIDMTGGGLTFLNDLTKNGGASKVFYGANIPYKNPRLNCSDFSSLVLAENAFQDETEPDFGIGLTCSLGFEGQRPNRINQAFITIVDKNKATFGRFVYENTLPRQKQEEILSDQIKRFIMSYLKDDGKWTHIEKPNLDKNDFYYGVLYPGSFNPFHEGHFAIYNYLVEKGKSVVFEFCVEHFEKDNIELEDIANRIKTIKKFIPNPKIIISNTPLFKNKALYNFAVGTDVYNKIDLSEIYGKKFYVFKRGEDAVVRDVDTFIDIGVPDISSTEIKNANTQT